jgi:hypothetical protein
VEKAEWFRPGWSAGATVRLKVPADATLRLASSNAPVVVGGILGAIEARSSNAPVEVRDGRGVLVLQTSNAPIVCQALDALVDLKTSNAPVEFIGTVAEGVSRIKTSNAPVDLKLPEGQDFRLEARTSNAEIDSDFAIDAEGDRKRTRLVGATDQGAAAVLQVETTNGDIEIEEEN